MAHVDTPGNPPIAGAWHVVVSPAADQELPGQLRRLYTPLSSRADYLEGRLDLLVKSYPGGLMSQHFDGLANSCARAAASAATAGKSSAWQGMLISEPRATSLSASTSGMVNTSGLLSLSCK